jgi:hypothetical protein
VYAKERRLVEIVKAELQMGHRCCHVMWNMGRRRQEGTLFLVKPV